MTLVFSLTGVAIMGASAGCSSDLASGVGGPLTECAYTSVVADEMLGIGCTVDDDCRSEEEMKIDTGAVCLNIGDQGNITNEVFGFCTRSCDCDDDKVLSISGGHATLSCVYLGGCFPGQGYSRFRYAAIKCTSVSDCQAYDSRYTHCELTDKLTTIDDTTCGQINAKVCQAHSP